MVRPFPVRAAVVAACALVSLVACSGSPDALTDPIRPTAEVPILRTAVTEGPIAGRMTMTNGGAPSLSAVRTLGPRSGPSYTLTTTPAFNVPTLVQIAQVDAPIVDRISAQASSIRTTVVSGNTYVIVGYNTRNGTKGAIDVFNATNPANPVLIQSLLFSGTAINAVTTDGSVVYMAEGTTDAGLGGSAVIESMGMKSTGQFQLPFQRLGAAGNVGTGVAASAGTAYLTTGENGGTYQFAMSNGVLTRVSTGLNRSLRDARAVGMAGGAVVATSGSSGGAASMTWYLGGTPVALPLTGVIDAGAKGDIFIDPSLSSYAITTMGSGGIAGLLTGSANIFATLALPTAPAGSGISPIDIRANGVTGAGGYVFVAYGGLGIGIVATPTSTGFASGAAILSSIGAFQFTPAVSANGIGATPPNTANQGAIFVATQTGLKVLQYTLPATRCQTNPDGKKKKNEETCTDD